MKCWIAVIPITEVSKRELLFRLRHRARGKRWQFGIEVGSSSGYEHYQCRYESSENDFTRERGFWTGIKCELQEGGGWSEYECKDGNFYSYVDDYMGKYRFSKLKNLQCCILAHGRTQGDRKITTVIDKLGGTGKTFLARRGALNGESIYIDGTNIENIGRNIYDVVESKGTGRKYTIIIDITRAEKYNQKMWAGIETVKNGYVSDDRYSHRSTWIYPPIIYVFGNHEPENWKGLSEDRWDKIFLKENKDGKIAMYDYPVKEGKKKRRVRIFNRNN